LRKIIIELSKHYAAIEDSAIQRKITAYASMKGHAGWSVHVEMLMLLRGSIAEELLSERFTKLDATEKDVQQRAFSMVDELIKFLVNPLKKAQDRAKFIRGFEETTRRK